MAKNILIAIIYSCFLFGCDSYQKYDETTLIQETKLKYLPLQEQKIAGAMISNKEGRNIYADSVKKISMNGYVIVFPKDKDDMFYVIKDESVVVGVSSSEIKIFNNNPKAPIIGEETVLFAKDYIKYTGSEKVFEDYGLNGESYLIYKKYALNGTPIKIVYKNKACKIPFSNIERVGCCDTGNGVLEGYYFDDNNHVIYNQGAPGKEKLKEICLQKNNGNIRQ